MSRLPFTPHPEPFSPNPRAATLQPSPPRDGPMGPPQGRIPASRRTGRMGPPREPGATGPPRDSGLRGPPGPPQDGARRPSSECSRRPSSECHRHWAPSSTRTKHQDLRARCCRLPTRAVLPLEVHGRGAVSPGGTPPCRAAAALRGGDHFPGTVQAARDPLLARRVVGGALGSAGPASGGEGPASGLEGPTPGLGAGARMFPVDSRMAVTASAPLSGSRSVELHSVVDEGGLHGGGPLRRRSCSWPPTLSPSPSLAIEDPPPTLGAVRAFPDPFGERSFTVSPLLVHASSHNVFEQDGTKTLASTARLHDAIISQPRQVSSPQRVAFTSETENDDALCGKVLRYSLLVYGMLCVVWAIQRFALSLAFRYDESIHIEKHRRAFWILHAVPVMLGAVPLGIAFKGFRSPSFSEKARVQTLSETWMLIMPVFMSYGMLSDEMRIVAIWSFSAIMIQCSREYIDRRKFVASLLFYTVAMVIEHCGVKADWSYVSDSKAFEKDEREFGSIWEVIFYAITLLFTSGTLFVPITISVHCNSKELSRKKQVLQEVMDELELETVLLNALVSPPNPQPHRERQPYIYLHRSALQPKP